MNYGSLTIDPETLGGTPMVTGTRAPVQTLFDYLEGSSDLEAFLDDHLSASKEAAAWRFAASKKNVDNRKTLNESFT